MTKKKNYDVYPSLKKKNERREGREGREGGKKGKKKEKGRNEIQKTCKQIWADKGQRELGMELDHSKEGLRC